MAFHIGGAELQSRFFLGTAGYPSPQVLREAIGASGTQVITVGRRRPVSASKGQWSSRPSRSSRSTGTRAP